jgi:hypothetical protein
MQSGAPRRSAGSESSAMSLIRRSGVLLFLVGLLAVPLPAAAQEADQPFAALAGDWDMHGFGLTVYDDGSSEAVWRVYRWCGPGVPSPCDRLRQPHHLRRPRQHHFHQRRRLRRAPGRSQRFERRRITRRGSAHAEPAAERHGPPRARLDPVRPVRPTLPRARLARGHRSATLRRLSRTAQDPRGSIIGDHGVRRHALPRVAALVRAA